MRAVTVVDREIKNRENFLFNQIWDNSRNFVPAKISRYTVYGKVNLKGISGHFCTID